MSPNTVTTADVDQMVSAVPVPILVVDYHPILEHFSGWDGKAVRERLANDESEFNRVITLPRVIAANPEWVRMYGSPVSADPPDLRDRHFTREAYPELFETLVQQFTAPFFGTTSILREHTAPALMGDVIVRSHWRALLDRDQPTWDRVVIVDLDVTDLRTAQRDLERLLEDKEKLVNSKDQLIASVSHEIRTPLASIVGFAQLLRDASDLSPEDHREMIELLVHESADLTNIIDDLLVSAKADMGQLEISMVTVDLKAQAAQAIEGLDASSRASVRLPKTTARCVGDPARVRQIVRNLISNAFRYGGPDVIVEVEKGSEMGSLRVRDNGNGIPEEHRQRIFEAYERADMPASGLSPSLGLGLHISRSLAKRMGGDLTYRYEKGYSVFHLSLPLDGA